MILQDSPGFPYWRTEDCGPCIESTRSLQKINYQHNKTLFVVYHLNFFIIDFDAQNTQERDLEIEVILFLTNSICILFFASKFFFTTVIAVTNRKKLVSKLNLDLDGLYTCCKAVEHYACKHPSSQVKSFWSRHSTRSCFIWFYIKFCERF